MLLAGQLLVSHDQIETFKVEDAGLKKELIKGEDESSDLTNQVKYLKQEDIELGAETDKLQV